MNILKTTIRSIRIHSSIPLRAQIYSHNIIIAVQMWQNGIPHVFVVSLAISDGAIVLNPTPLVVVRNKSRRADADVYHEAGKPIKLCVPKVVLHCTYVRMLYNKCS